MMKWDYKTASFPCVWCGDDMESPYIKGTCTGECAAQTAPDAPAQRFDDHTKGGTDK